MKTLLEILVTLAVIMAPAGTGDFAGAINTALILAQHN